MWHVYAENIKKVAVNQPTFIRQIPYGVQAGFPSPAEDLGSTRIDLNEQLIIRPASTFLITVRGDSMKNDGISDGDQLLVDRYITPRHGQIVVANLDDRYTIKRLYKLGKVIKLQAANPDYPDIVLQGQSVLSIWGVVTWVLKNAINF